MKTSTCYVVLLSAVLIPGCLSKPNLVRESFAFTIPAPAETLSTNGPELGVRRIVVAPPFNGQALVYRTGEFSYEHDPYAEFLGLPAELLIGPLCEHLRNSGVFREVTGPNSIVSPDVELEITVLQLYGDFRNHMHPAATLQMRFLVTNAGEGSRKLLLQKDYTRNIPLQARTAAALVAGWNEALKEIPDEAAGDLKGVVK